MMKITVLGAGAWGMALAGLAHRRGAMVRLWGRRMPVSTGGVPFVSDMEESLEGADMVIFAIPTHALREVGGKAVASISPSMILISAIKGIEEGSDLRISQVLREMMGKSRTAVISGPTFAEEVNKGMPSAIVCASEDEATARAVQSELNGGDFRVYTHHDVVGVELGGALKNVVAIAAGICVGMGLGSNALAALITRGAAELARVGTALGGQTQTFYGLSGIGDLILTCSSSQSRNRRLGEILGQGGSLENALKGVKGTVEGLRTARSVNEILQARKWEAPVMQEVYQILHEGKPAREALKSLMSREPKAE